MRFGRPAFLMWRVLFILGLAGTMSYAVAPLSEAGRARVFVALAALAATAAAAGRRRSANPDRRAWLWTSVALGGFAAGALVASRFSSAHAGPFGSAADLVLLLSCAPLALAAGLLGSTADDERRRWALLDALILSAVATVVVWDLMVAPLLADDALGAGMKTVGVTRPLVDVVLAGLVVRLLLSRPKRDRRIVFFSAGAVLLALANLVFCGLKLTGRLRAGPARWSRLACRLSPGGLRRCPAGGAGAADAAGGRNRPRPAASRDRAARRVRARGRAGARPRPAAT